MKRINSFYLACKNKAIKKIEDVNDYLNEKKKGAELLEYILITALVVLLIIAIFALISKAAKDKVTEMTGKISSATAG